MHIYMQVTRDAPGIGPDTELMYSYSLKCPDTKRDTTQHVISAIFRQRNTQQNNRQQNWVISY